MFRTKKKSSGGAAGSGGGAQRKRKSADVAADDVDDTAAAAAAVSAGEAETVDGAEDADDALLKRMRERNSARRGRTSASASTSRSHPRVSAAGGGALSFEAEGEASASRSSKTRMQPNLLHDASDGFAAAPSGGAYSLEALAELRKQQNVLLRGDVGVNEEQEETSAQQVSVDVAMDEIDGATVVVEEEEVEIPVGDDSPAEADEFIPLRSKLMQARKKRSRVTFGVHESAERPTQNPEIVEVEDDEEEDEGRQWEEDIMRRGGLRAQSAAQSASDAPKHFAAHKTTYPTRRRVPSGTLAGVLTKLQRSLDAANFENDRAERELARIGAETQLIKESVATQREQLLASSEEFEYFQVVEDYVKGLSFCLREKIREIDANEREIAKLRVENVRSIRDADAKRAQDVANKLVAIGAIASADVHGLRIFEADSDCTLPSMGNASVDSELAELLKCGFVDRTPAIRPSEQESDGALDVFADAIDDMNSLEHVYGRFQEWRAKFPQVYASCYCDLALEKLYAPYVRAELLFWDPLSVCDTAGSSTSWGFGSFRWRSVLLQHVKRPSGGDAGVDDGPVAALVRDVVFGKTLSATSLYFDPFSSLHTRSICALLEEVEKHAGYADVSAQVLQRVVQEAATQFVAAAKLVPLVAIGEKLVGGGGDSSSAATISDFATYQLGRFNALLDNVLTFFVALPRDASADSGQSAGFRCIMQVLHQLLAYLSHCERAHKTLLVPQAALTVSQLTASPYLQQLLASSSQEQELQHVLALFAPFCATTKTR